MDCYLISAHFSYLYLTCIFYCYCLIAVLSGTEGNLREYEKSLRKELLQLQLIISCDQNDNDTTTAQDDSREDPTTEWLDIKYCHLRNVSIVYEAQMFMCIFEYRSYT